MPELEAREWIAYGLITVFVISAAGWGLVAQRKYRIRKLRLTGDSAVKKAELHHNR